MVMVVVMMMRVVMIIIIIIMKGLDNDIDGDNGRIDDDVNGIHGDKDDDDGYNDKVRIKIKYVLTIV